MDRFVDNLIEDEAERESLLAKPTCFIVVGRPGVGKSTLAKKIAESWKCILVDDTDLLNTHIKLKTKEGVQLLDILFEGKSLPTDVVLDLILARLNSPDVEHYGYVLSCLPFQTEDGQGISEQIELIQNLKLRPDFIINIKCADLDIVQRLSGLKQHPETGQIYNRHQWEQDPYKKKKEINDQDVVEEEEEEEGEEEEEEEEVKEVQLSGVSIEQMVWTPETLLINIWVRINMYRDTMLRPLEDYIRHHNPLYLLELDGNLTPEQLHLSVISHLGSMAIKPISIPVLLQQPDEEDLPEDMDTEDLLRYACSIMTVAPGFRWRRSRWGRSCPVALKESMIIPGKPEFSVGFQDKLYILSSQEAYQKFVTNPRPYLLPPMPRPPCRVSIIGPPQAGKSTLCKLLAQHYNAVVVDMKELMPPALAKFEQERLDKIKEETTKVAIEKIKMIAPDGGQEQVTEDHPEVQAMVLTAVEEATNLTTSPISLYAEVLQNHIKEVEEMNSDGEGMTRWVLDNFPKNLSEMEPLQQAGILPDIVFCLGDSDGHQVLKRLYNMNKESVDNAIKLKDEHSLKAKQVLNQKEEESERQSNLQTVVEETDDPEQSGATSSAPPDTITKEAQAVVQPNDWDLGYPSGPEMNEYKQQLQQFVTEWQKMQAALTIPHWVLEIDTQSPEILLQELVHQMEKPFQYVPWELSAIDLDEEADDMEAFAELERGEEVSSESDAAEKEDETETTAIRLLGDTQQFCPVALKNHNVLWPCTDEISAKYREKTFNFSSQEARKSFIENPTQFVTQTEPLKPPALRILLLGTRGSGKTANGKWLAQQLGLFHIQFRDLLQMYIIAKTQKQVLHADEEVSLVEYSEDLEAQIMKARGEDKEETEDTSDNINDMEQEVLLTDEEMIIKAYLYGGEQLNPKILDMVILPFWKEEPYMSTGFILEGFPNDSDQVQYMLQRLLFADVVIVMDADFKEIKKRLLPAYLESWRERHNRREAQLKLLRELHKKNREDNISNRRAELLAQHNLTVDKTKYRYPEDEEDDEDDEAEENVRNEIETILEDEFPSENDDEEENAENGDAEDTAADRLETEIEERFSTDENNVATMMELLKELNIPKLTINTSRKLRFSQRQLLQKIQPMLTNRESLFQKCQSISCSLANKLLLSSYKLHSAFGYWDPISRYNERDLIHPLQWSLSATYPLLFNQYIYFFNLKENRNTFMLNPLKYLQQPKPTPSLPVKLAVIGPPKSGKTSLAQKFAHEYSFTRLSMGDAIRMVLNTQEHTDLAVQIKRHLSRGLIVPDELAIQCLEVALMSSMCRMRGYVLDGFPATLKQAMLMESLSIIPMIVVELQLDTEEVLKRGLVDKMKFEKPYLMHDSSEILHKRNYIYKSEAEDVRKHFQQHYQNLFLIDGLNSKWRIWSNILKEVSISMKYIHTYLEKTQNGQAACINRLCVTPKELECQLGEFDKYCPVCWALHYHLVDCSETVALTHAAEYRGHYYQMCDENHLERFLSNPDTFVTPGCPHAFPQPHLLPEKLTEFEVKNMFPQQAELRGFCPVTYLDGKQRFRALVQGTLEYAVEYRERIYLFETKEKQAKFMSTPEKYWDQRLPNKVPPLCEPVQLTSLPTLGYVEQGISRPVIKALTAAGCFKPKYPFLSIERSVLLYVVYYLKAFNHKSTVYTRQKFKKKLASFEEDCALIPYLSSAMMGNYRPLSECPIDFEFKLKKFLAFGDLPEASGGL